MLRNAHGKMPASRKTHERDGALGNAKRIRVIANELHRAVSIGKDRSSVVRCIAIRHDKGGNAPRIQRFCNRHALTADTELEIASAGKDNDRVLRMIRKIRCHRRNGVC